MCSSSQTVQKRSHYVLYVHMYVRVYVRMYVCMYVCMYNVRMYVHMYVRVQGSFTVVCNVTCVT